MGAAKRIPVINPAAPSVCQLPGLGPTNFDISTAHRAPSEGPTEDAGCTAPLVGRDCHWLRPTQPGRQIPDRQCNADRGTDRAEPFCRRRVVRLHALRADRKSTRLNSSHVSISYAVFCLK